MCGEEHSFFKRVLWVSPCGVAASPGPIVLRHVLIIGSSSNTADRWDSSAELLAAAGCVAEGWKGVAART